MSVFSDDSRVFLLGNPTSPCFLKVMVGGSQNGQTKTHFCQRHKSTQAFLSLPRVLRLTVMMLVLQPFPSGLIALTMAISFCAVSVSHDLFRCVSVCVYAVCARAVCVCVLCVSVCVKAMLLRMAALRLWQELLCDKYSIK